MVTLSIGTTKSLAPTAAIAVQEFWALKMSSEDSTFTASQLRFYLQNNCVGQVSPSTADRVLRLLRQKGNIDYIVENRGLSLYRAMPLGSTK
jgi:hypothetical protein